MSLRFQPYKPCPPSHSRLTQIQIFKSDQLWLEIESRPVPVNEVDSTCSTQNMIPQSVESEAVATEGGPANTETVRMVGTAVNVTMIANNESGS